MSTANIQEAKPCPFCGSRDLSHNLWSLDDGEVDAIECNQCYGSAPSTSWNDRYKAPPILIHELGGGEVPDHLKNI